MNVASFTRLLSPAPAHIRMQPVRPAFFFTFLIVVSLAFLLQISGISIGRWGLDAGQLLAAMQTEGAFGAQSVADYVVAFVTPYLRIGPFYNGVTTIGLSLMTARILYQLKFHEQILILFILFPIFFQLQFVSKEAIIIIYVIIIFFFFYVIKNELFRFCFIVATMLLMATFFRNYYFISLACAACFFFFRGWRLWTVLLLGLLLSTIVDSVRDQLLTTRYFIYYGVSMDARSLLPLLFSGFSWTDFIGNYVVSAFFFMFPLALGQRVQELYMQIYVVIIFATTLSAFRYGNRMLASLFLGLLFTFPLFVAELGTLIRHVSGVAPILFCSLFFSESTAKVKRVVRRGRPVRFHRNAPPTAATSG